MKTTEPIRDKRQVRELKEYYLKRGELRNHLLIVISIHTALRIGDVLRINSNDVYDFENRRVRETITLTEKKTGKSKITALNKSVIAALYAYFPS
jgi:integrase